MKLCLVAVGARAPAWVNQGFDEYAKRLPRELRLCVKTVKTAPRNQGRTVAQLKEAEAGQINAALPPAAYVVALDEHGERLTTAALARRLKDWQRLGRDVALIVGGPDGLAPELLQRANERLRLSDLTLPHTLVRVLLAEQLYRAWAINSRHPYHRT